MRVKVTGVVKYAGKWRRPGDVLDDVPEDIAKQMVVQDTGEIISVAPNAEKANVPPPDELDALRRELARLQEFERQTLAAAEAAAEAERKALAAAEEAERNAVEEAAGKGKAKPAPKE